jgi:hypothetical protein
VGGAGPDEEMVEALRLELRLFRDENGSELLNLPESPLPPADASASLCLMPDYDNLILSRQLRQRVISAEHRKKVFLFAARVG